MEKCGICDLTEFKCKLVTKDTGDSKLKAIKHPALAIWDPSDDFGGKKEVVVYLIHLVKVNKMNLTKEEIQNNIERFEIQCRGTLRSALQEQSWDILTGKVQDLKLENGLVDVAHWCLKYELEQNYASVSSSLFATTDSYKEGIVFVWMTMILTHFGVVMQVPYV